MDRLVGLCGNDTMAPVRQHLFIVGYTALLLSGLAALWFRPHVSDWPAWVQAIGSIAAIAAAIWIAQWQASRERTKEDELRLRRERAARAVTPLALTQICAWAEETMTSWREAARRLQASPFDQMFGERMGEPGVPDAADVVFSKVPESAVRDIQSMIEACSEEQAKPYVALLQVLQVQQTRAAGYVADINSPRSTMAAEYCFGQVVETAEVYARASELFNHARDENAEEATPVSRRQIGTALYLARAYEDLNPDLTRVADRMYGAGTPAVED
ncbi:hypothetical protein [Brevundimonas vesicularis]|uniref:hypothetical protein n=1 Tax=Brevundimonas vesicularis TaxID=41276 RepID=UPI00157269F7|nr:hypothetical protein [Brevundimonas vesicularis]